MRLSIATIVTTSRHLILSPLINCLKLTNANHQLLLLFYKTESVLDKETL